MMEQAEQMCLSIGKGGLAFVSKYSSHFVHTKRIGERESGAEQGCQMVKFDPFLSLDCARAEGVGGAVQGKEGIKFCSVA